MPLGLFDWKDLFFFWDSESEVKKNESDLGFYYSFLNGSVVDQVALSYYSSSTLQTELLAILEAVKWSIHRNFTVV